MLRVPLGVLPLGALPLGAYSETVTSFQKATKLL